jgi:hypothetical protein
MPHSMANMCGNWQQAVANLCGIIERVTESDGIRKLRQLAARRRKISAEIDEVTEALLRDGEFVEDIAGALGESRETVRRFRNERGIPDAREVRRAKGAPLRRPAG